MERSNTSRRKNNMDKEVIARLKKKIKQHRVQKSNREKLDHIPDILMERFRKLIVLAVLILFCGIIFSVIGFSGSKFIAFLLFGIIALAVILIAIIFKKNIEYNGYTMIEGEIVHIKYSSFHLSKTEKPINYHVRTKDLTYQIPVTKHTLEAPLYSVVRVYASHNMPFYSSDGLIKVSSIWCIELISEPVASTKISQNTTTP